MKPILYIVIPCYNEQEVLPQTAPMFLAKLLHLIEHKQLNDKSRVLFVDDGSGDNTYTIIKQLSEQDEHFSGIALSRNRGHQNALLAGLYEAQKHCDVTISIDCDGQDDINAMDAFVDNYKQGCDIVYGVRDNRDTDTFFKRFTAESFYKVLTALGAKTVFNHADYRLMTKRAIEGLFEFSEVNLFLRGLVPLVGYKSATVGYKRNVRIAGESHYPLSKMISLALDGMTSLSNKPLRLITTLGSLIALAGFVGALWTLVQYFFGSTIDGWSSTTFAIFFMGGVQLLCIGILGEYIGKIYLETKKRPRFIIANRSNLPSDEAVASNID